MVLEPARLLTKPKEFNMRLFLLGFLFLTGCITMPSEVRTYESKADNTRHVDLEPGWLAKTMDLKMGLHRSSDMAPGTVTMVVMVRGNAVNTRDGLVINIDGKRTVLSAMDDLSDFNEGFFRKRFEVKMDLVRQMVAGKSVWVRVNHVGQTYEEGEFSQDNVGGAKRGFIKFLAQSDGINGK
jgi:hypothetical protein